MTRVADKPAFASLPPAAGAPQPKGRRAVVFAQGSHDTPVYDRATLRAGDLLRGPALVEEPASVTVLGPEHQLRVADAGHLVITRRDAA